MAETLGFDIRTAFPGFRLEIAAEIPLDGITALTGPSGSGKTTLLRVLAGLERRGHARVRFGGRVWDDLPAHKRGIGYVFQDARLFDHMNVAANLNYGAARRGASPDHVAAVIRALALAPLLARHPSRLSGGEQRRVALGRALASRPRILFLDEPLAGLDPARKTEMRDAVSQACRLFAIPALFVSHDRDEVLSLAGRELRLRDGQMVEWAGMPPRIAARATVGPDGTAGIHVAGQHFALPGAGGMTGPVWLGLPPGAALLSRADPGAHDGITTLKVTALPGGDGGQVRVGLDNQVLTFPAPARSDGIGAGTPLWLTLIAPRISARFECD